MARNLLRINGPVRHTPRRIDKCHCEEVSIYCSSPTPECSCQTSIDYRDKIEHFTNLLQYKIQKFITKHKKILYRNNRYNKYNMIVHSDISKFPWYY
jgi:hypothetical protein